VSSDDDLYSWGGMSKDIKCPFEQISRCSNKEFKYNWCETDILIFDGNCAETISQLSFDLLDQIARNVRKCQMKPFGGLQIIYTNLLPISTDEKRCGSWNDTFSDSNCQTYTISH